MDAFRTFLIHKKAKVRLGQVILRSSDHPVLPPICPFLVVDSDLPSQLPTMAVASFSSSSLPLFLLSSAAEPDTDEYDTDEGPVLRYSPPRSDAPDASRRTLVKPNPRPLPPSDNDGDDEVLNPFARGGLRRSPIGGLPALPELDSPEPELPPTAEQPDPPTNTPPMGIHTTPSSRPRRSRVLAERPAFQPITLSVWPLPPYHLAWIARSACP
jgi:hypothetical protein